MKNTQINIPENAVVTNHNNAGFIVKIGNDAKLVNPSGSVEDATIATFDHIAKYNCVPVDVGNETDPNKMVEAYLAEKEREEKERQEWLNSDEYKRQKEERRKEKEQRIEKARNMPNNENATAKELYEAFQTLANNDPMGGWNHVDRFFLGDNALTKKLVSQIGTGYSATPYDDGAVIIKSKDGVSYTNKRNSFSRAKKPLSDLIY